MDQFQCILLKDKQGTLYLISIASIFINPIQSEFSFVFLNVNTHKKCTMYVITKIIRRQSFFKDNSFSKESKRFHEYLDSSLQANPVSVLKKTCVFLYGKFRITIKELNLLDILCN